MLLTLAPSRALRPLGSSHRPLASRCRTGSSGARCGRRAVAVAADSRQQSPLPDAFPLAAALAAAGIALPAGADEAAEQSLAAFGGSDALAAAQAAAQGDPTDLLFSTLFTIAVGALVVVTLGIAYLSYTSWNDSRLEAEDRRRVDQFRPGSSAASPSKKATAKAAAQQEKEPEEFRGFGKK